MMQLNEIVASVINVPAAALTPQSGPANRPEWDSLAHISVMAAVEQTYNVQLTMADILSIKTIADLRSMLERHGVSFADSGLSS